MTDSGRNNFPIYYIHDLTGEPLAGQKIWELLVEVDQEFVPALSSRDSPIDVDLSHASSVNSRAQPHRYFNELLTQRSLVVEHAGDVVGFLSFREDYLVPEIGEHCSAYVSTVAVDKAFRRGGLARNLYIALHRRIGNPDRWRYHTTIRTWSTNFGHNQLVQSLGYEIVGRVENGRGPGIDTLIYGA